jgi:hypothetical protein
MCKRCLYCNSEIGEGEFIYPTTVKITQAGKRGKYGYPARKIEREVYLCNVCHSQKIGWMFYDKKVEDARLEWDRRRRN